MPTQDCQTVSMSGGGSGGGGGGSGNGGDSTIGGVVEWANNNPLATAGVIGAGVLAIRKAKDRRNR